MRSINAVLWAVIGLLFAFGSELPTDAAHVHQTAPGITREDIFVPHVSTVPANAGQAVQLAVRHLSLANEASTRGAVLFTNGGFTSTLALMDLDHKTYSLAAALAEKNFDVYLMEHTGFGRSPRPMMDNPCNVDPSQQQLLIPNPLRAPCTPSYPHHLSTIFTELPEIDSVVNYIRQRTGRK